MRPQLETSIAEACKKLFQQDVKIELTRPDEQFGDYATNAALQLAGKLGKNPREVAQILAGELKNRAEFGEVEVAGPGFMNITLPDTALLQSLSQPQPKTLAGQKILVEYSDPNPLKPLHAGHLYTTLIGDMIARLVEHAGAETIRLNYGGDVGLHVGKSMWAIVRHLGGENSEKLADITEADRPAWLGERYVEGNNAYLDNPRAKQEITAVNKRVYELHAANDHDSAFAQIYWTCRQWSYEYFTVLYDQLQVVPFDRFIPESEVTPLGVKTVQAQLEAGVYELSDGAVIFDGEKFGLHKRVFINSEGLPTYEAKDVGLSLTKWRDYSFDESIIITAAEQQQYMEVVIKSIEQFAPEPASRTKHLVHGLVKLQGGVKMSSRKGNIVTALEILGSAREAGEMTGTNPSEETILAAVKYAFAKNRIGSDIAYDPKESIALEGNSGPYLQYAHARACSISRKAAAAPKVPAALDQGERSLVRKLSEYGDVIVRATEERMPHHICTYLYELSQVFNRFYEKTRVIGDEREPERLFLVQAYAGTLKEGLGLIGIHAPEEM
jgi:arginyl-tRNA synthetase